MKRTAAALAATALFLMQAPAALAHTHIDSTSIADNATLAQAPANFSVTFGKLAGLADVSLTNSAGAAVPLNYKPTSALGLTYTIPLPKLAPGEYTLALRSIAEDGNVMTSPIHFTIGAVAHAAPVASAAGGGMGAMMTASIPKEGATLAASPASIDLTFVSAVTLQALSLKGPKGAVPIAFKRAPAAAATFSAPMCSTPRASAISCSSTPTWGSAPTS
jgi:methionine-rich copper-binding protein CopC